MRVTRYTQVSFDRNPYFALLLIVFSVFTLVSCSKDEEGEPALTDHQLRVIEYFKEVALGFESRTSTDITRKWMSPMRVFVGGDRESSFLQNTLNEVITEINAIATDGFRISIVSDSSASNTYFYFGSASDFIELFPEAQTSLVGNLGIFNVWWNFDIINRARIFVETERTTPEQQKSLIYEELTQSLGLGKDSPRYPNSIFYETASDGGFATSYSDLDRELIRLLYHPKMKVGLNATTVDPVLVDILLENN